MISRPVQLLHLSHSGANELHFGSFSGPRASPEEFSLSNDHLTACCDTGGGAGGATTPPTLTLDFWTMLDPGQKEEAEGVLHNPQLESEHQLHRSANVKLLLLLLTRCFLSLPKIIIVGLSK